MEIRYVQMQVALCFMQHQRSLKTRHCH